MFWPVLEVFLVDFVANNLINPCTKPLLADASNKPACFDTLTSSSSSPTSLFLDDLVIQESKLLLPMKFLVLGALTTFIY